jgi:hypothetical protein
MPEPVCPYARTVALGSAVNFLISVTTKTASVILNMANAYIYKVFLSMTCNKVSALLSALYLQTLSTTPTTTTYQMRYEIYFT